MRVLIFGSSVALAVRPPRDNPTEGTYADLLRRELGRCAPGSEVINLATRSRMVTHETTLEFTTTLQRFDPDVVIFHYGINEAAPRAIPYDLWMWLHAPQECGRAKAYFAAGLSYVWPKLIRAFRLGGWVTPRAFGDNLSRLIAHCRKESAPAIFLVNVGPPNERYQDMLPGIAEAITAFNQVIAATATENKVGLLDANALVQRQGLEKAQPDGCHLSAHGHECLFVELVRQLTERGLMPLCDSI